MTQEEFDKLWPVFIIISQEKVEFEHQKNQGTYKRKPRYSHSQALKTHRDKLIFILYDMKNYPTDDVMGFNFEIGQSTAEAYVNTLCPILEETQKRLKVLPVSTIETPEKLSQLTDNKVILVDTTERSHYRHKDYDVQKKLQWKETSTHLKKHCHFN